MTIRDNNETFHLLLVQFKDEELTILNRHSFSELNETSAKLLNKDYPLLLHLEGDPIISKEVQNIEGYRNSLIFKSNPDDFYFYEYHQEDTIYASITRKEILTKILAKLNELDQYVTYISFGPFVLINLLPVLKNEDVLVSNYYELVFSDNSLVDFKKKGDIDKQYKVGNEAISERETVLIASLIAKLYPNPSITYDSEYLNNNKEEFKYKKLFKFYGAAVIVTILAALFISHFILQSQIKELAERESLLSISNQTLVQLNNLKEEQILKEKILISSGVTDRNYITKYFSDIGHSVPNPISLDFINIKKPSKKIRPNEKVKFDLKNIEVGGYTNDDNAFNNWIKTMRQIDWVKQIEILEYNDDSKSKNSFLISVTL